MCLSSPVMAQIPFYAFSNITFFFQPNREYYSPILGAIALESGLIANLRFDGFLERGGVNSFGEPKYINDRSSDPVWNVIKILFPSPTGQLGIKTTSNTNFARYVNKSETVALLLNFTEALRTNNKVNLVAVENAVLVSLNTSSINKKKKNNLKNATIKPLLDYIQKSIEQEKTSIYPIHTLEQILLAFFCYKFNNQEDILNLLTNLDNSIIDKNKLSYIDQESLQKGACLLTEDELDNIASDQEYIIDTAFDLIASNVLNFPTPYKGGTSLLSNGTALPYDRKGDIIINQRPFADCGEMSGRHIINVLTYDSQKRRFELSFIEKFVQNHSPDNPYFENFIKFYEFQTYALANAGDIEMRSLWNKVMGDLNAFNEAPLIAYVKDGTNEINTGFVNFIRAFQKIFGLSLEDYPNGNIEKQIDWVNQSLQVFFSILNPIHDYEIKLVPFKKQPDNDILGKAAITVINKKDSEDLFSFNWYCKSGHHSEVNDLKILKQSSGKDYVPLLQKRPTHLQEGTTEESLGLLDSRLSKSKIHHPLYRLFSKLLADHPPGLNF
jgi:hypothetical protein